MKKQEPAKKVEPKKVPANQPNKNKPVAEQQKEQGELAW